MMNYFILLSGLIFILSLMNVSTRFKYLLSMLLSLEMMILSIFILLTTIMSTKGSESSLYLSFLALAVCESSLGLSILVSMSRTKGNIFISSTKSLMW